MNELVMRCRLSLQPCKSGIHTARCRDGIQVAGLLPCQRQGAVDGVGIAD